MVIVSRPMLHLKTIPPSISSASYRVYARVLTVDQEHHCHDFVAASSAGGLHGAPPKIPNHGMSESTRANSLSVSGISDAIVARKSAFCRSFISCVNFMATSSVRKAPGRLKARRRQHAGDVLTEKGPDHNRSESFKVKNHNSVFLLPRTVIYRYRVPI